MWEGIATEGTMAVTTLPDRASVTAGMAVVGDMVVDSVATEEVLAAGTEEVGGMVAVEGTGKYG